MSSTARAPQALSGQDAQRNVYPTVHEDVLTTVAAFQATGATTDQEIVDELIGRGYDRLRAELLTVFVPLGLARAVIARLPSNPPVRLPETAIMLDGNRELVVELAAVPEFQTALHIGEETFAHGIIPRDVLSSMVGFSVELKLINQILNAGKELGGATFSSPILTRLADTPGFAHWYETLGRNTSEVS